MPVRPVPMVNAFEAVAVTVIEPPKLTDEPLIVMALLANCALETVPDRSVVGMVNEAVMANAPLPYIYPVKSDAPVPPLDAFRMPPNVMAPLVLVFGVKPVLPALKEVTPPVRLN